jgi:hypothetical protein
MAPPSSRPNSAKSWCGCETDQPSGGARASPNGISTGIPGANRHDGGPYSHPPGRRSPCRRLRLRWDGEVRIADLVSGGQVRTRAIVVQKKIGRPVQFELLGRLGRASWTGWSAEGARSTTSPSRGVLTIPTTSALRRYARLVDEWVTGIAAGPPRRRRATSVRHRTSTGRPRML